jgi:hypothetical protein
MNLYVRYAYTRLRTLIVGAREQGVGVEPPPDPAPRGTPAAEWDKVAVQIPGDGFGPLFHRRYRADIRAPRLTAEQLMARVQRDVGSFSPHTLAEFKKTSGRRGRMAPGDEYAITILGPWNGSVRVVDVTPTSFTFVTLRGHPEAGQITFRAVSHPAERGALRFEILSWARSRDMLVSLTYKEAGVGQEIQKNAWVTFCERVVKASGGALTGEVVVDTEERDFDGEAARAA